MTITDEWLEAYEEDKQNGELSRSVFWRLAVDVLPLGVDGNDPRVIAAVEEIKIQMKKRIELDR